MIRISTEQSDFCRTQNPISKMNSSRILQKICPFILLVLQGVHSDIVPFKKCPNISSDSTVRIFQLIWCNCIRYIISFEYEYTSFNGGIKLLVPRFSLQMSQNDNIGDPGLYLLLFLRTTTNNLTHHYKNIL